MLSGCFSLYKNRKPATDAIKSNPSKRHRDRLNCELERLTNVLPFPENVCSRLDKLSVLRLSVGYLKVKSFFNATTENNGVTFPTKNGGDINKIGAMSFSEGDLLLQALNGFVLVVTAEGYVFYASPTIQDYLGFHQSDVVYQSVFEFIHVDDRAMFRRHLHFALNPNLLDTDKEGDGVENSSDITRNVVTYNPQHIPPENSSFLERNFACRFRCLLDNSSGFLKLNFQGRLKLLHGQRQKAEDGSLIQPQLALFAIATPVQTPAILEIRTKTLIFQTKHKLDFTPMGIDSRGKVVLGYTEMELCMRGSGYQFIHAADMMYCADNHVRMIKTGESGMTVFRLLMKNGGWVWVQANARLVYKGGRPDFIIARQRALVNAEGEEHLRQRSMQLPFSLTTGEAVLYDTHPTLNITNPKINNTQPSLLNGTEQKASDPASILGYMQSQEKSIYNQPSEIQFTADDAFLDSWALFNVPSHSLRDETVKEEDMMDVLEQLAKDGDLCTALQQIEVDNTELNYLENALLSMTKDSRDSDRTFGSDEILTNDIFSYVEDALSKETNRFVPTQPVGPIATNADLMGGHSGQLSATAADSGCDFIVGPNFESSRENNPDLRAHTKQDSIGMANSLFQEVVTMASATEDSKRLSLVSPNAAMGINVPGHHEDMSPQSLLNNLSQAELTGQEDTSPQTLLSNLSHTEQSGLILYGNKDPSLFTQKNCGPKATPGIFSINASSCLQLQKNTQNGIDRVQCYTGSSYQSEPFPVNQTENMQINNSQNNFQQPSHPTINNWNKMALGAETHTLSLSAHNSCVSSDMNPCYLNPSRCPQQSKMQPFQQWQQAQPVQPGSSPLKSRLVSECCFQALDNPGFPLVDVLPESSQSCSAERNNLLNDMYHSPPDRLRGGPCSLLSSCMFDNHSPLDTNADQLHPQAQAVTISAGCRTKPSKNSPPQASCYFQWMHNKPVVGTCSIPQEDACISPLSCQMASGIAPVDMRKAFQRYLGCNGQTQVEIVPVEDSSFSCSTLARGVYLSEISKGNCCNL
uniref:Aryl hydrocarbon receptor 2 n=1 Tax=Electrophorus electricus TaxID=8005 RepID=A0A4W4HGC4_ELEEL